MSVVSAQSFTTPSGVVVNEYGNILSVPMSILNQVKIPAKKTVTCTSIPQVCLHLSVNQTRLYAISH